MILLKRADHSDGKVVARSTPQPIVINNRPVGQIRFITFAGNFPFIDEQRDFLVSLE